MHACPHTHEHKDKKTRNILQITSSGTRLNTEEDT